MGNWYRFLKRKAPVAMTGAFLFRYSGKHIFLEFTQNRLLCFFKSQNMVMKFTFKRKKKNKRHIWRGKIKIVGKIREDSFCFYENSFMMFLTVSVSLILRFLQVLTVARMPSRIPSIDLPVLTLPMHYTYWSVLPSAPIPKHDRSVSDTAENFLHIVKCTPCQGHFYSFVLGNACSFFFWK